MLSFSFKNTGYKITYQSMKLAMKRAKITVGAATAELHGQHALENPAGTHAEKQTHNPAQSKHSNHSGADQHPPPYSQGASRHNRPGHTD